MCQKWSTLSIFVSGSEPRISKANEWFRANKLSLHHGKTKYSIFCNPEKNVDTQGLDIFFNNNDVNCLYPDPELIKPLESITTKSDLPAIKFLGLYMDQYLNFKFHIKQICNKLSSALICIRRCKNFLSDKAMTPCTSQCSTVI